MSTGRAAFADGVRDVAPILIGVMPFGVIAGVAAIDNGLNIAQAVLMSSVIFAGASQLAAVELIGDGAVLAVIVGTVWVINSRMMMYSAALAPHLVRLNTPRKALVSYLLTDQAFATSVLRYQRRAEELRPMYLYYLGSALALWVTWQLSSVAGIALGEGVPASWSLDFAVPLVFIALLFPAITDRPTAAAAVVAVTVAIAARPLAYNLGLLVASVSGIVAGLVVEGRRR